MGNAAPQANLLAIYHDGQSRPASRPKSAFSTSHGQMSSAAFAEGLHAPGGADRRTLVSFAASPGMSFRVYQVEGESKTGSFVGSSSPPQSADSETGVHFFITCAHNVVNVSPMTGAKAPYTNLFAFGERQGSDKFEDKVPWDSVVFHPQYDGDPACGFDIAICFAKGGRIRALGSVYDSFGGWADAAELAPGLLLEISGYPGEPEKIHYPYTHRGPLVEVKKTAKGGHILTYRVDTSPGNSGSPVFVVDPGWVERGKKKVVAKTEANETFLKTSTKVQVAVHTGSDTVSGVNFGTLITPELNHWIGSTVAAFAKQ